MLASIITSEAGGRTSQLPVLAGGRKPHIFLSSSVNSVMSKFVDDTEEGMVGYSFPHCVALRILLLLRDCSVGCTGGCDKTPYRLAGGCILLNASLKACDPSSTRRRHRT